MTDLTVPPLPVLVTIPNVELGQTGTWETSSGVMTWRTEDLYSCVAALDCPAVRRPVLKFGHTGEFGKGDPTIGYIANMAVADDGRTLVGDYAGMPSWLGEILASAYPDRSGEWEFDYRCQMGHTHPCVLHAVALLGVERPAIGSIASLQDVATVYGVAASIPETGRQAVVVTSSKEPLMPNPQPRQVAASVTSADVSRAFYASPLGADWDIWIEEIQVDPLQVIYCNDATGDHYRLPVTIGQGDGTDAVSFGEPVRVVNNWTDQPSQQAAASAAANVIRFATREESRPGAPSTSQTPAASASGSTEETLEVRMASFTDEQFAALRSKLGIADENADADTILAAVDEVVAEQTEETAPPTPVVPEGSVIVEESVLEELRVAASAGQEARNEQLRQRREQLVSTAINEGRIAPARREHWLDTLEKDPGAEQVLTSLAPGLIPVTPATGTAGGSEPSADDADYLALFPDEKKAAV